MRRLLALPLAVLLLGLLAAPAAAVEWQFASENPVGSQPRDLVIAQFDDDTGNDLMVANSTDGNVEWKLSNGDGTFGDLDACNNGPLWGVSGHPGSIAKGQWTGQTVGDGVVAAASDVAVLTSLRQGNTIGNCGFIAPNPTLAVPFEGGFTGLSAADLNGDGNDDAVASGFIDDELAVAMMAADGSFASFETVPVGNGPLGSTLADFDGDGKLDVAVANFNSADVYVALGRGDGSFDLASATPGNIVLPNSVAALHANGDSALDLVVGHENGLSLVLGQGGGTFFPPTQIDTGAGFPQLSVADVNGDKRSDILVGYADATGAEVLLGRGNGTFTSIVLDDSHIVAPQAIDTGDFTGDGSHDLAIVNNGMPGSVTVLRGVPEFVGPDGLDFGDQRVDVASATKNVTITNPGSGTLHVGALTLAGQDAGDFQIKSDNCRPTVLPGASCQVALAFEPSAVGAHSAELVISDNAAGGPHSVALSGSGVTPTIDFNPQALSFGGQNVGTRSTTRTVTLTNEGGTSLDVSAVALTGADAGHFELDRETCTDHPVPIGGTCEAAVAFDPTSAGAKQAGLRFSDDAPIPGSTQTVALSGTGTQPAVDLSPPSIDFGGEDVGDAAAAQTVTVTNSGDGPLQVENVAIAGANPADFEVTSNGCGASVPAGQTCTISVAFEPTAEGARSGTLRVASDAPGPAATVALAGEGLTRIVTVTPGELVFGDQRVGQASAPQTVTISNVGSGKVEIGGVAIAGPNAGAFELLRQGCTGSPLAPGSSCAIVVGFEPGGTGAAQAALQISDDAAGGPRSVALSGTGVQAQASFARDSLKFGSQRIGKGKARKQAVVTNPGTAPLDITAARISGAGAKSFNAALGSCAQPVPAGASCGLAVSFKPKRKGVQRAVLALADDAPGSSELELSGRGKRPKR